MGLAIRIDHPQEAGADRLVNSVAAFEKYGGPCIIVDLGTAITFDAISAQAEYLGGVISAGVGISVEALFQQDLSAAAAGGFQRALPCDREKYCGQYAVRPLLWGAGRD